MRETERESERDRESERETETETETDRQSVLAYLNWTILDNCFSVGFQGVSKTENVLSSHPLYS